MQKAGLFEMLGIAVIFGGFVFAAVVTGLLLNWVGYLAP